MAKFCGNCGAQVEDDAKVCGNCGVPLDGGAVPNIDTDNAPKKSGGNKILPAIIAAVVAIIVIIVAVNIVKKNTGYRATLNRAFKDIEKVDSVALADEFSAVIEDIYSEYGSGYIEDAFDKEINNLLDDMEDKAGANPKISYRIKKASKLSDRKVANLGEEIEKYDKNYDKDLLTQVVELDLEVNVKGPEDKYSLKWNDVTLVKEDGKWKILYIEDFGRTF